jgi:hypothetical protein
LRFKFQDLTIQELEQGENSSSLSSAYSSGVELADIFVMNVPSV